MRKNIVFVVGTTASGKSNLAMNLAINSSGSVCNMDSVQVYNELDIGSAKPTQEEQASCPHRLFDVCQYPDKLTAGDYRRLSLECINSEANKNLFFVGGSGFYVQALEKGMFETHKATDEERGKTLDYIESVGWEQAFEKLQSLDPEYASKLHLNDKYRIQRALEVCLWSGETVTSLNNKKQGTLEGHLSQSHNLLKVGVYFERDELKARVHQRVEKMIDLGLIDEVRTLVAKGYKGWTPLESVGYKEVVDYLEQSKTKEQLVDEIVKNTMRLAKKQRTWFQRDDEIKWFHGQNEFQSAVEYVNNWLGEHQ